MKKLTHLLNVLIAAALLLALAGAPGPQAGLAASPAPEQSAPAAPAEPAATQMPAPILQWAGLYRTLNDAADTDIFPAAAPNLNDPNIIGSIPDTSGAVGYTHFLQAVNKMVALYTKNGTLVEQATFAQFWATAPVPPIPSACFTPENHHGQPYVIYDHLNLRWVVADVAYANIDSGPYYICLAVSKSNKPILPVPAPALPLPAGTYFGSTNWLYYSLGTNEGNTYYYPDMPKIGLWPDGYYVAADLYDLTNNGVNRNFTGVKVWAVNDSDLVNGVVDFNYVDQWLPEQLGYEHLIPSNLLGAAPPTGTPNYFAAIQSNTFQVWEFKVDWNNLAASTFGVVTPTPTKPKGSPNYTLNVDTGQLDVGTVVPQAGTGELVDAHGDRLMSPLQYRTVNGVPSLWANFTVQPGGEQSPTGVRWLEARFANDGTPNIVQSSVYQPDGSYRWLGSLAVDRAGNMALGFSRSSASAYPTIAYAGRLRKDPANQITLSDNLLVPLSVPLGAQFDGDNDAGPWGRQSQMSVDPLDDCVFWYTNMYYTTPVTTTANTDWQTRIGFFSLKECRGGATTRVSLHTNNTQGNLSSGEQFEEWGRTVAISADGRYVAFASEATNLVNNDTNNKRDVFVRDRDVDGDGQFDEADGMKTVCITCIGLNNQISNGNSWEVSLSSSGRMVAFMSDSSNLVANDTNGAKDVFVYDRGDGTMRRVSVTDGSVNGNGLTGEARHPFVSGDGRYVAFDSTFINLVTGDTNNARDVFVRELATNRTYRVSLYNAATTPVTNRQLVYESATPVLSEDGSYVVFASRDPQLAPTALYPATDANLDTTAPAAPAGTGLDVFVSNWKAGVVQLVSYIPTGGATGNGESYYPYIAAGGRQIAFASRASDLVTAPEVDTNNLSDIFVWDQDNILVGTFPYISRISVSFFGAQSNGDSFNPSISGDGRYVAFSSNAKNLDSFLTDTNNKRDVFLHDRGLAAYGIYDVGLTQRISLDYNRTEANGGSVAATVSSLGDYVAFASEAEDLVNNDSNLRWDVFVYTKEAAIPIFLTIPGNIPGPVGSTVQVPVNFTGNGYNIDTLAFAIDYDETCLEFLNGASDVTFSLSNDFTKDFSFNAANTNGEMKVSIYDSTPPRSNIPDGTLMYVKFEVKAGCAAAPGSTATTRVGFSITPAPSFGGFGQSIRGASQDGFVTISDGKPGDCNGDNAINAGDLSGLVLEIFDGDGTTPSQTPNGTFAGNAVGCNPNLDNVVDAGDLSCIVLTVFGGSCGSGLKPGESPLASQAAVSLALPSRLPIRPGMQVAVPVTLAGQGQAVNSAIFSLDYDQTWLSFDPTDANGDGLPDAISLRLPDGLSGAALFDAADTDGELDLAVFPNASLSGAPAVRVPDGVLAIVTFTAKDNPGEFLARVKLSEDPGLSFGNPSGQSVPGAGQDGAVWISELVKLLHLPILYR